MSTHLSGAAIRYPLSVDKNVIVEAMGELDRELGEGRDALRQVESDVFGYDAIFQAGTFADPKAALGATLERLEGILEVVLEAAAMPETRLSLIKQWEKHQKGREGLQSLIKNHQDGYLISQPFETLSAIVEGLRISVSKGMTSEQAFGLNRLEFILGETAVVFQRRGDKPTGELDIQRVMFEYLRTCFPDFTDKVVINGSVKNFAPDCGIRSLKAAVEFKFIGSKTEVPVALSGIVEDTAGYRGSPALAHCYSLIYQVKPFVSERRFHDDVKRVGAVEWRTIVVTGDGQRGRKHKAKPVGEGKRPKTRVSVPGVDGPGERPHRSYLAG